MSAPISSRAVAIDLLSVWAVRYALGRATYAVSDVVNTLLAHRADLSAASRAVIIRDIEERLVISGGQLGMPMDTALWLHLRDALRDA
jgi:hypothetical protein